MYVKSRMLKLEILANHADAQLIRVESSIQGCLFDMYYSADKLLAVYRPGTPMLFLNTQALWDFEEHGFRKLIEDTYSSTPVSEADDFIIQEVVLAG